MSLMAMGGEVEDGERSEVVGVSLIMPSGMRGSTLVVGKCQKKRERGGGGRANKRVKSR